MTLIMHARLLVAVIVLLFALLSGHNANVLAAEAPTTATGPLSLQPQPEVTPPAPPAEVKPPSSATPSAPSSQTLSISDALTYVQTLVTILATIFGFVTILFGLASFFGLSEISKIRQLEHQLNEFLAQTKVVQKEYQDAIEQVNSLSREMKSSISEVREEFATQSRKIIEAGYYFTTGENFYKGGDDTRAIENYKMALVHHPNDVGILYRIGRALVNLSRLDEAEQFFEKMLLLDPNSMNAYYGLATVWRYRERRKALEFINKAILVNSSSVDVLNYKGLICRDAANFDDAINAHTQALNIAPNAVTHFYLALLWARQNDLARAKMHIFSANVLLPDSIQSSSVRDVWAAVIKWAVWVFEADKRSAKTQWKRVQSAATTERVARAIGDHVEFLTACLGVNVADFK